MYGLFIGTSQVQACRYETPYSVRLRATALVNKHKTYCTWNSVAFTGFTARRSYTSAVLAVVILSVCSSIRLSHAFFVTKPNNALRIF